MTQRNDIDGLHDEAWRLVSEGLKTGTMTLNSGKVVIMDAKLYVSMVQWLANQDKKKKSVPLPEDFHLRPTSETKEA